MLKNFFRFGLLPIRMAKAFSADPNKFRYWLHKKTGRKFRPKALEFPPMIIVETSSYCNLACIHCPRTNLAQNSESFAGFMDFNLYKKIVDEISQYHYTTLRPFARGEALINPDLPRMIGYAKRKGVRNIWLNTNGVLLSPEKSKALLETGIDRIEVSIDSANRETFQKIKGKDKYETVVENTLECCKLKNKMYPKTEIVVSFVESSLNSSESDEFMKFWQKYADHVNIRPVHQHGALIRNLRNSQNEYELNRFPCSILWKRIEIAYHGALKYCEFDWENVGELGNVTERSIRDIWNSRKYKQLRASHIKRRFSELPLCNICKSYREAGTW